jgi:DNA-binding XRE family transcriptional regulator
MQLERDRDSESIGTCFRIKRIVREAISLGIQVWEYQSRCAYTLL